jgi:putative transposase
MSVMPRSQRASQGELIYHVLNRANAGLSLFEKDQDFAAFEKVLVQAHERVSMRTIAYCVMPNHWHFVLWPYRDGDLSEFVRWLTVTHTQRWHVAHDTVGTGHLYQGRFKSFPVESDEHLLTVCRYVERNALQAGLVERAEDWRWSSLWRRTSDDVAARLLLSDGPLELPQPWCAIVNCPKSEKEEEAIEGCIRRGRPFGSDPWAQEIASRLGLQVTLRPRGRPTKYEKGVRNLF